MRTFLLAGILGVCCLATDLRAGYLLSGCENGLCGSANFSVSNNILTITVTNTSTIAASSAGQVLTGVYFSVQNGTDPNLTSSGATATAPAGSVAINGSTQVALSSNTDASSAWGFDKGLSGTPFSMPYGFISTALSSSCSGAACGSTLSAQNLTAASVYGGLVNQGGQNVGQWVDRNSVIFTLNLPANTTFTSSDISSATFQFGDAGLGETDFQVLPEPSSYAGAIMILLIPAVWWKRRRRASSESKA